jgi:DNA-binding SARP family transcriptional activator
MPLLEKALRQSARFNITNIVFWRPKVMRKLFAEALKADMETEYVKSVIRARSMLPEAPYYELIEWPFQFRFYTLGRFQVVKDGSAVVFKGKAQKNAMALLKALIASGTTGVAESYISDILWPDADGDEAYISLKTTLHRLRQFLGSNDAVIYSDHKLTLDFRFCFTDVFLLEEIHKKIDAMRDCLSDKSELNDDKAALIRQLTHTAVDLYNGEFLPGDENYPWVAPAREALRNRFIDILSASVSCAINKEQWRDAERLCLRGIEVDALAENLYRSLIICYGRMNLPIEAHRTYNRFCDVLHSRLGIKPGFKIDSVK